MSFAKFELMLENGETVICSLAGQGSRIGFISGGPGSFYFHGLSRLENNYTFVACDSLWTYRKSAEFNEKPTPLFTKNDLINRDHLVVNALKHYFNVTEIDGFGFSAPGAMLFEQALHYPKDFHHLIGTGVGLIELDAAFKTTNDLFYRTAAPDRKQAFERYQTQYTVLQSAISQGNVADNAPFGCLFDVKPTSKLPLKPHKKFVAETISMTPKLIYELFNPAESRAMVIQHWKHNPFGEHIDKRMQEYFFTKIYPQLKPLETLIALAAQRKKVLLIYGSEDYITPLPPDVLAKVQQQASVEVKIVHHAAHMPYFEMPNQYAKLVMDFLHVDSCPVHSAVRAKL